MIELLVVVAIISALIAILLPSMNRAVEMANRAVCASRQHQWTVGALAYAADHVGVWPDGDIGGSRDDYVWFNGLTWDRLRDSYGLSETVSTCSSFDPDYIHHSGSRFFYTPWGTGDKVVIGWNYWGNRREDSLDSWTYQTPKKVSGKGTSQTFLTCFNYNSFDVGKGSWSRFPHTQSGSVHYPSFVKPTIYPQGLVVSGTDASAAWVDEPALETYWQLQLLYYRK